MPIAANAPQSKNFRRPSILAAMLVSFVLVATGCGSSDSANNALSLNGDSVSVDKFEKTILQLADAEIITLENGQATGEEARSVLGWMLRGLATSQIIEQYNEAATQADKDEILTQIQDDPSFDLLGPDLKDLILSMNAEDLALARIKAPSEKEVAAMYEKAPASLGAMCVQHILVEESATADKVLKLLNDGGDFKKLAGEYSIEPNAGETGGVLGSADGDCLLLSDYQEQIDPGFTAGALLAKPGVPYGPVKSGFGYHVILARPYADISSSLNALLKTTPGQMLVVGLLATSTVTVGSQYGHFDAATNKIVAN
jgi:parvulin-like peptidyl-prolyl isomerase